jgi:hypothetical protein
MECEASEIATTEAGRSMLEAGRALERLLALEELRSLQSRLCRAAGSRAWHEFERGFTEGGQLRVFDPDGSLAWFALSPHIGSMIDVEAGPGVLVVHACGEELRLQSASRAEGVWAVEYAVAPDSEAGHRRRRGYGTLHQTYVREDQGWLVRSADLVHHLRC